MLKYKETQHNKVYIPGGHINKFYKLFNSGISRKVS
jgi:hypothetical protein